jgi:hypothetical protein
MNWPSLHKVENRSAKWLVGLRFHDPAGTLTRHYFLLHDGADAEEARQIALARAQEHHEREARHQAEIDGAWAEICPIRLDLSRNLSSSTARCTM